MLRYLLVLIAIAATAPSAMAEKRVALVVGNAAYVHTAPLANPLNDARDMAEALKGAGFDVVEALDADKSKLDGALRSFTDKLAAADVALFFYAGHGLQVGAQNYLVPTDAKLERERDLEFEAVKLEFVLRQMEIDREGKTTIVFLDACRDNPLSRNLARSMGTRSASIGRGLAAAATGLGTFIAYSTQPGNVALDGAGRNSPFTAALKKHMTTTGRNLPATMIEVRREVVAATDGKQVPWDHSAMTGDFYFVPGAAAPPPGTVSAAPTGSAADLAALQERLRTLEEDAKNRAAATVSAADVQKLADLRARAASLDELAKDLQKKLMSARMEEGKARDPAEKAKLQRDSMNIQMEWTRRSLDLKKIKEDIAAIEGTRAPAGSAGAVVQPPPVMPKPTIAKFSPAFDEVDAVRLAGSVIRSFKAKSPAHCRDECEKEPTCAGFQHGRKVPFMGQCELMSAIEARFEDQSWRSGMRKQPFDGTDAERIVLPEARQVAASVLPGSPSWQKFGFDAYEGFTAVDGSVIKQSDVDSAAGCLNVCKNTAKCVASTIDGSGTGQALRCTALSSYMAVEARTGHTIIVRRSP